MCVTVCRGRGGGGGGTCTSLVCVCGGGDAHPSGQYKDTYYYTKYSSLIRAWTPLTLPPLLPQVPRISDVSFLLGKMSAAHIARVMGIFMRIDPIRGPRAAALLLECMSPLTAIR